MKKWAWVFCLSMLLVFGVTIQASAVFIAGDNTVYFENAETLFAGTAGTRVIYNASGIPVGQQSVSIGDRIIPGAQVEVGDTFVGILSVQNISQAGDPNHFFSTPTNQLSGVFAQQIMDIDDIGSDAYDANQNTFPHVTLGASTLTSFQFDTLSLDISSVLDVANGEMFAFYLDTGVGATVYETNGTLQDDMDKATDGNKYFSLGLTDNGYAYSHPTLGTDLDNFTGEAWAALNMIVNNTGWLFDAINDPNESELGGLTLLTSAYFSSEIEGNPFSTIFGGTSPWDFDSNDPAHLYAVVPEPSTFLLLGAGLLGLVALRRKKQN